jgi:hypothetical protein
MINKDKRSLILSMILGDGCLHYVKRNDKLYGAITLDHGNEQSDYIAWKCNIVKKIFDKEIKLRPGHNGKSIQFSVCSKKLRAWRKFCYPNNKKSIKKILPFIQHPEFALAVWLMDDGYVQSSFNKLASGEKKNYGARFRIYSCDQSLDDHEYIKTWFKSNFNLKDGIKISKFFDKKQQKHYPFIKFTQTDSLIIWEKIREVVLSLKSMQHKFRYIEEIYQSKKSQRVPE